MKHRIIHRVMVSVLLLGGLFLFLIAFLEAGAEDTLIRHENYTAAYDKGFVDATKIQRSRDERDFVHKLGVTRICEDYELPKGTCEYLCTNSL